MTSFEPLTWDEVGEREYETGVDHGVLYIPDETGAYANGVSWNGLTTVTESPAGAEATPIYADNIKYLNLISAETFGATIEAFTYPEEFEQFDGISSPSPGVAVGQQPRKAFGLSYRTKVGNDTDSEAGYKLHLVYGCQAAPSEKAYATVNDTPEAISFSWALTTSPVNVTGMKPTALITIDSTKVDATALGSLEDMLYGTATAAPSLPLPDDVIALFPPPAGAEPMLSGEEGRVDSLPGSDAPVAGSATVTGSASGRVSGSTSGGGGSSSGSSPSGSGDGGSSTL